MTLMEKADAASGKAQYSRGTHGSWSRAYRIAADIVSLYEKVERIGMDEVCVDGGQFHVLHENQFLE